MRRDQQLFADRGAEIVVIGPHDAETFRAYWMRKELTFTAIPDPDGRVANLYGQPWGWFKRHRLPSVVVVDREGQVRYRHDGTQMWDIPPNKEVLALIPPK